uniref:glycerophosphodiester phosphodiesterase n=1 Tax=Tanacetum cinerariifolium TaxID=118510 RepID=A0A6L2MCA7_TANCI|nr:glycerophosphodiester phosphodiesterase GDPD1, chloroplastic-like [Tanacetum cinerariifolium]
MATKAVHVFDVPNLDQVPENVMPLSIYATRLPTGVDVSNGGFKENSILSFNNAAKHPIDFIEFDVQVTKDDVAIIFHDDTILFQEHGEKRVTDLTLNEFFSYGPQRDDGKVGKSLARKVNGNVVGWQVESNDHSCTLQEAFEKVNPHVGFNIELKFDDNINYDQNHLIHVVQVILKVVHENAQDRPIIFSSFQPDAALLIKKLQEIYSVYFLTNGGTQIYADVRRNSLEEAKKVSLEGGLDGILSEVKGTFRNPSAAREIKESNLSLLTYGKWNNFPETVHVQHLMGIDGVIVDLVEEITRTVDEFKPRNGRGDVKSGEIGDSGRGIELSSNLMDEGMAAFGARLTLHHKPNSEPSILLHNETSIFHEPPVLQKINTVDVNHGDHDNSDGEPPMWFGSPSFREVSRAPNAAIPSSIRLDLDIPQPMDRKRGEDIVDEGY